MEKKLVNVQEEIKKNEKKLEAIQVGKIFAPLSGMLMFLLATYSGMLIATCSLVIIAVAYGLFSKALKDKNIDLGDTKDWLEKSDIVFILCLLSFPCAIALSSVTGPTIIKIISFLTVPTVMLLSIFSIEKDIKKRIVKLNEEEKSH